MGGAGKAPTVKPQAARKGDLSELLMFSADLGANALLAAAGSHGPLPLLVVLDAAAILRMVDRTFGGRGEAPSPLPDSFPGSADLMIRRLEAIVAEHLRLSMISSTLRPCARKCSARLVASSAPRMRKLGA